MKKVILSIALLIDSVFASSTTVDSIKSELESYRTYITALNDSIIVENFKNTLNEEALYKSLFPAVGSEIVESKSEQLSFEPEEDFSEESQSIEEILEVPSIHLPFANDDNVLSVIKKYSEKIIKYLTETLEDMDTYIGTRGEVESFYILREAIENAAFGKNPKMKEKRNILMEAYTELISQM